MSIDPHHPTHTLLVYFEGEPAEPEKRAVQNAVETLAGSRAWALEPPQFIDQDVPVDGAAPIPTVGAVYSLYSGYPPWGDRLPKDVDQAQLDEVESLLDTFAVLSARLGRRFVVELEGETIGEVEGGELNDSLRDGLLDEWRRVSDARG